MGVQEFERFSECEGGVLECCRKGAFIMLENGEKVFAYKFGNLSSGTRVICSFLKPACGDLLARVSVDSVVYDAA